MIELRLIGSEEVITYDPQRNLLLKNDVPYSVVDKRPSSDSLNLRLALGKKCNFACAYCIQSVSKQDGPEQSLDLDILADEIIRFLGRRKIQTLSFWGGEPFLYLDEMKSLLARLKPSLEEAGNGNAVIFTNGSLLADSRVSDWILVNPEIFIMLSYDGPGQDVRGRNIFDDPLIVERVKWLSTHDRLGFSSVFTKANHSVAALTEDLAQRLGREFKSVVDADFLQIVDQSSADLAAYDDQLRACLMETYAGLVSGRVRMMPKIKMLLEFIASRFGRVNQAAPCHALSDHTLTVDLEGNLLVCQTISSRDDGGSYCLGNIRDQPAGAPVPVPRGAAIRQRWATLCADCHVRHFCAGGCLLAEEEWQPLNCRQKIYKHLLVLMCLVTAVTGRTVKEVRIIKHG
ncbi:MAG: 4Fe-4S cluster-binding domain-containing protein [Candidatus Adiutrix sp.]|jgi:radical SAM protein with 4Fe4S-binding SPASM domain|nr:4Fe-4S cluster-binding domain-containing protein [Candidatus Adiutrix sp.]